MKINGKTITMVGMVNNEGRNSKLSQLIKGLRDLNIGVYSTTTIEGNTVITLANEINVTKEVYNLLLSFDNKPVKKEINVNNIVTNYCIQMDKKGTIEWYNIEKEINTMYGIEHDNIYNQVKEYYLSRLNNSIKAKMLKKDYIREIDGLITKIDYLCSIKGLYIQLPTLKECKNMKILPMEYLYKSLKKQYENII